MLIIEIAAAIVIAGLVLVCLPYIVGGAAIVALFAGFFWLIGCLPSTPGPDPWWAFMVPVFMIAFPAGLFVYAVYNDPSNRRRRA